MTETTAKPDLHINEEYAEKYGFHDAEDYVFKARPGLSREIVEEISRLKNEPDWMRALRLKALDIFYQKPLPTWGGDLAQIDFDSIYYYIKPAARQGDTWEDVPPYIKKTFDRLGIPQAEQKFLAGVGAQYESEVIYHKVKQDLADQGVIFLDTDSALREHPEIFKEYFGTVIPPADNKFAALNTAVWSGGSFIYVPKGVRIEQPLQAYFRINAQNMGQFERTLIIVDEDAYVHYVEGCFLAGARVRTRTGEKRIEDIEKGDEVLTHRGRFRRVYRTMERPYRGMIYRIRYFGDSSQELQVTEEHPLLVVPRERLHNRNREFGPEWRQASEVKPGDYLVVPALQPELAAEEAHAASSSPWNGRFGEIVERAPLNGGGERALVHRDEQYLYVAIRSIEIEEVNAPVYNFSVEEDESYVAEGVVSHNCTAPIYSSDSLHSAVVEIIVKKGARCRYTTIQNWSTNVFNLVTKRAVAYDNATMEWVDGNLGCLAEGSTVTTPAGVKPIEALEVGEKVLSLDEATGELCFRRVMAKKFSGYQRVREVAYGERRIRVTDNHPFYSYVYDPDAPKKLGRYRLGYVRADRVTEAIIPKASRDFGESHALDKPVLATTFTSNNQYALFAATRARPQRVAAPENTTPELMWLFGLFLGDGHIYRQNAANGGTRYAKVGFSTPRNDRARGKLVAGMGTLIQAPPTERPDGVQLDWNSIELADLFEKNGFVGTAHTKRIPEWAFSVPEAQRLALLAGYLDADGCFVEAKRRASIKSANVELLRDVARLATTLGITTRLFTEFEEEREVVIAGYATVAHGSHRLEMPVDERVLAYLSDDFRAKVEAARPAQLEYHRNVGRSNILLSETLQVVKVSVGEPSAEPVPTWDIEVEGTGNFVAEGFIVHNSKLTMKYPAVYLMGPGAKGEVLSIAMAARGQHQDAGGKVVHGAPHTTSRIISKSISKGGGRATYRGLLKVYKGAEGAKSNVVCDALLLDPQSRSDTYPVIEIDEDDVTIGHEATVSKVSDEQLFYLMSRGMSEEEAASMIVQGFIEPLAKELPMEYSIELNRLIQLQMEGSVG